MRCKTTRKAHIIQLHSEYQTIKDHP